MDSNPRSAYSFLAVDRTFLCDDFYHERGKICQAGQKVGEFDWQIGTLRIEAWKRKSWSILLWFKIYYSERPEERDQSWFDPKYAANGLRYRPSGDF